MNSSKKILLSTIFIAVVIVALVGVTFAFFNYTRTGSSNIVKVGRIYFNTEQGNSINLSNVFPIDKNDVNTDTDNVGSVSIHITGDTTYSEGVEYLVTAEELHNTVGTKKMPINIDISYSANNNKTIGINDASYYTNRGGDTSRYKVLQNKLTSTNNNKLIVGYIVPGNTGIDGTINIKAYIDKDKIAISDTYPSTTSGYFVNTNLTNEQVNSCITYVTNQGYDSWAYSGETLEGFCAGTGTLDYYDINYWLENNWFSDSDVQELLNMGIIAIGDNGTTTEWLNGRTLFTTSEWNSLNVNGISFKIKVEANEGIWTRKPENAMNEFPRFDSSIEDNIKAIYFNEMTDDEMHQRYAAATVKADLTYNSEGEVLTWLEDDVEDVGKYIMYVASNGETYLTTAYNLFYYLNDAETIVFNNVNTSRLESLDHMFLWQNNLKELDVTSFDTSNVENMSYFIRGCTKLETVNMSGLDLRKVKNMNNMLYANNNLKTVNLDNVRTRDIETMSEAFASYQIEYLNLEGWGGDNLVVGSGMFINADGVKTVNMKNFNFGKSTSLNNLFYGPYNLESVDLSGANMPNVESMSSMFSSKSGLTSVNLSNINMPKVTDINYMFNGASSLKTIYVSDTWNTNSIISSTDMFGGCTSLVGGNGTTYDANHIDKEYARIDTVGNPGYLTLKTN